MIHADQGNGWRAETEQALMEAFRRVVQGRPRHDQNIVLAKRGSLRVTIAAVAREAGRSRTLIGSEKCRYPKVREAVLAHINGAATDSAARRATAADLIKNLRADKATLSKHVGVLATRLHDAFLHNAELERRCNALERDLIQAKQRMNKMGSKSWKS